MARTNRTHVRVVPLAYSFSDGMTVSSSSRDVCGLRPRRPGTRRVIRVAARALALCLTAAAIACYLSYRQDQTKLRAVAQAATADKESPEDRALALLHRVYGIEGTHKNGGFFILPRLRATPLQVLRGGGDCADRSRLLWSMLREVGIRSTMAMCFDPATASPSHTVVEAQFGAGANMVVDPTYDLFFPKAEAGGYHGLLDLRRDPGALFHRLDRLCSALPRSHPIHRYNRGQAVYDKVSSINWDKNVFAGLVRDLLLPRLGDDIYHVRRPTALEEPKLFMAICCLGLGGIFATIPAVITWAMWFCERTREGIVGGLAQQTARVGKPLVSAQTRSG